MPTNIMQTEPPAHIGLDIVRRGTMKYDRALQDLVQWYHRWCVTSRCGTKQQSLLSDIPYELSYAVQVGRAGPEDQERFRTLAGKFRTQCGVTNKGLYADTTYSRKIIGAVEAGRQRSAAGRGRIVKVDGNGGVGKTTTLKAIHQMDTTGRVRYLRASCVGGLKSFAYQLVEVYGQNTSGSSLPTMARLRRTGQPGDVLIVDEIHQLVESGTRMQKKIEFLRELIDLTEMTQIWVSTDKQFDSLLDQTRYKQRQISHRTLRTVDLPDKSPEFAADTRSVFAFLCPHLDFNAGLLAALQQIHDHHKGGFGMIGNILDAAISSAGEDDRSVNMEDIKLEIVNRRQAFGIPSANKETR